MEECHVTDDSIRDVYHIKDELDVCVTLIVGEEKALLFDTGYGLGGLKTLVERLTDKPLTVVNSHAHWDHALGNWLFPEARLHPDDFKLYASLSAPGTRADIVSRAEEDGALPDDFDEAAYMRPPKTKIIPETGGTVALGGIDAEIISMPGHTRGSLILWIPQRELLVMGDNWNPTVWMFFAESLPVTQYRENLRGVLDLPFRYVLTSHGERVYPRETLERYVAGMTDEMLRDAPRDRDTSYFDRFDTRRCFPLPDMPLVFDGQRR